jgi:anti-anti-sigma factor
MESNMSFNANLEINGETARITLSGELDASVAEQFKQTVEEAAESNPSKLVLLVNDLQFMASAGLRVIVFAKQKMGQDVSIYVVGATGPVLNTLQMSGFDRAVYLQDEDPG